MGLISSFAVVLCVVCALSTVCWTDKQRWNEEVDSLTIGEVHEALKDDVRAYGSVHSRLLSVITFICAFSDNLPQLAEKAVLHQVGWVKWKDAVKLCRISKSKDDDTLWDSQLHFTTAVHIDPSP
jgi:hypothetical protein